MPVYLVHGFRWPREGFTGIRVHTIVHNLEDCSAEYIQNENSRQDLLESFQKTYPDLMKELGTLDFIEQYDPEDESDQAVVQPYAYIADKVVTIAGGGNTLSLSVDEVIANGPGLSSKAWEALADLRDKLADGEKIGWWVVYNGDPERLYDSEEEEDEADEEKEVGGASTPTQGSMTTPEDKEIRPEVPPKEATPQKVPPKDAVLPIRENPTKALPSTKESVPEPSKLKEISKAAGFRKKFFGKKG